MERTDSKIYNIFFFKAKSCDRLNRKKDIKNFRFYIHLKQKRKTSATNFELFDLTV